MVLRGPRKYMVLEIATTCSAHDYQRIPEEYKFMISGAWLYAARTLQYSVHRSITPPGRHQWVNRFDPRDHDYSLNFTITSSIIRCCCHIHGNDLQALPPSPSSTGHIPNSHLIIANSFKFPPFLFAQINRRSNF